MGVRNEKKFGFFYHPLDKKNGMWENASAKRAGILARVQEPELSAVGQNLGESSGPCIGVLSFGTETCIFRI